ncbi:MAG: polyprenyl synthetase family protein [Desulfovibrio sp.]|nr:polyprenyl synthetase family protein [Desulfovibrio sp.]
MVEDRLGGIPSDAGDPVLASSMRYSLMAGGKRLRPVLCLTVAHLFGLAETRALPFAAAIEMIHTYSLIHDDLPCMDNDDLRRGRPSNHKAFSEATALLAGDALLTDAFRLMTQADVPPSSLLEAVSELAFAAGSPGMVGGQALDMALTGRSGTSLEALKTMQALKTGELFRASCTTGALLAGATREDRAVIDTFGSSLGTAFQIVDDILDVTSDAKTLGKPVHSDEANGKVTYPSLVGLDESRRLAKTQAAGAAGCLSRFSGEDADFLRALCDYIVERAM